MTQSNKRRLSSTAKNAKQDRSERDRTYILTPEMRKEIWALLATYKREVEEANLSEASKAHYIDFAACFVRWMHGEFQPGIQAPRRREISANWNKKDSRNRIRRVINN